MNLRSLEKKTSDPAFEKPVRIGWILSKLASGGVARTIMTTMLSADSRKAAWSGITAELCAGPGAFLARLHELCPAICGGRNAFRGSVQDLVDRSDLVFVWGLFTPAGYEDLEKIDWKGRAVVVCSHGGLGWARWTLSRLLSYGTHFTAVSEYAACSFPAELRNRVRVLYNGVERERTGPALAREAMRACWGVGKDEIAVGYYGRYSSEKNPLAAAQAVRRLGAPFRSVYVGSHWLEGYGEKNLRHLDPRAVVHDEHEQIGDVLAGLDAAVFASHSEGHSLSLIECWQAGLPVVATPSGAVPELEKRYGPLVTAVPMNPRPAALAEAVRRALSPENRRMVENARALALAEFTAGPMASRFEFFIVSAARQPRPERIGSPRALKAALLVPSLWLDGASQQAMFLVKYCDPARIRWNGVYVTEGKAAHAKICRDLAVYAELHCVSGSVPAPGRHFDADRFTKLHDSRSALVRAACEEADVIVCLGGIEAELPAGSGKTVIPVESAGRAAAFFPRGREVEDRGPGERWLWNGAERLRVWQHMGRDFRRSLWGAGPDEKVVGYLGWPGTETDYLAPARALRSLPADYRAVYHGFFEKDEDLAKMIKENPGRVLAFLPEFQVGDILAGFDCLVSLNRGDSVSMSVIEAWLAGTPVVASPSGALRELSGRFGELAVIVPCDASPEILARAIVRAAGPEGREIAARAEKAALEYLTAEEAAYRWTDYFELAVKKNPDARPQAVGEGRIFNLKEIPG